VAADKSRTAAAFGDELMSPTLSTDAIDMLTRPLALDLTAAYALMRDDALLLVGRAIREVWTPDRLLSEIGGMIAPGSPPE
jgi:hypothetical protein